jgi:hypothetical protein
MNLTTWKKMTFADARSSSAATQVEVQEPRVVGIYSSEMAKHADVRSFDFKTFGGFCAGGTRCNPRPVTAKAAYRSRAGDARGFVSGTAQANGTTLHYVRGRTGSAVILLHRFPEDWYEYHRVMPLLAKQFTVVAVDLRGIGQ